jgi:isomerase DpgB
MLAMELLLCADLRLSNADFCVPHAILGGQIWPGMSIYRLTREIGYARCAKLFLEAKDLNAARAKEFDIIRGTVESLAGGMRVISEFLASAPLRDFAVRRRLMQDSLSTSFDEALGAHLAACDRALRQSDQELDRATAAARKKVP